LTHFKNDCASLPRTPVSYGHFTLYPLKQIKVTFNALSYKVSYFKYFSS